MGPPVLRRVGDESGGGDVCGDSCGCFGRRRGECVLPSQEVEFAHCPVVRDVEDAPRVELERDGAVVSDDELGEGAAGGKLAGVEQSLTHAEVPGHRITSDGEADVGPLVLARLCRRGNRRSDLGIGVALGVRSVALE